MFVGTPEFVEHVGTPENVTKINSTNSFVFKLKYTNPEEKYSRRYYGKTSMLKKISAVIT
jgi:hypothetical protein